MKRNVDLMVKALQYHSRDTKIKFFMIWGQEECETSPHNKIYLPNKPGVEAMFKPLSKAGRTFHLDPRRTLLIDDSPYKGCVNPQENCIYPPSYCKGITFYCTVCFHI